MQPKKILADLKFVKEVINQRGEVVQTGTTTILLAKRKEKENSPQRR